MRISSTFAPLYNINKYHTHGLISLYQPPGEKLWTWKYSIWKDFGMLSYIFQSSCCVNMQLDMYKNVKLCYESWYNVPIIPCNVSETKGFCRYKSFKKITFHVDSLQLMLGFESVCAGWLCSVRLFVCIFCLHAVRSNNVIIGEI